MPEICCLYCTEKNCDKCLYNKCEQAKTGNTDDCNCEFEGVEE